EAPGGAMERVSFVRLPNDWKRSSRRSARESGGADPLPMIEHLDAVQRIQRQSDRMAWRRASRPAPRLTQLRVGMSSAMPARSADFTNFSDSPFMQYRSPVGLGPSS